MIYFRSSYLVALLFTCSRRVILWEKCLENTRPSTAAMDAENITSQLVVQHDKNHSYETCRVCSDYMESPTVCSTII